MRKKLLLSTLLFTSLTLPVAAQQAADVAVVVNGQPMVMTEAPPRLVQARVLIPLRKVFNALGAEVTYEKGVISAIRGKQNIVLSPNQKSARIDGQDVELDVPPMLIETVTYVPLRFVAQALGDSVNYDAGTKQISVSSQAGGTTASAATPAVADPYKATLKRLVVGHQGAILKLWSEDMSKVAYYRGLDDRATAPYSEDDRREILEGLGIAGEIDAVCEDLISGYSTLPKLEIVALLGLLHSTPVDSPLSASPETRRQVERFLLDTLKNDSNVVLRRQACLALAVGDPLDGRITGAILDFYSGSENLWETFPVQQFFEFQAAKIRNLPNWAEICTRVESVNSLYTPNALRYLKG